MMSVLNKATRNVFCVLLLWATPCAAQETAHSFLQSIATNTASLQNISAHFVQEKKISLVKHSIQSQGLFCLQKSARPSEPVELLLWEYTQPAPSGFMLRNNKATLWTQSKANSRPVSAPEASLLHSISAHILEWVHIDAANIEARYTLNYNPQKPHTLRLVPRRQSGPFSAVEARFAADRTHLLGLTFFEASGDSMTITFSDILRNSPQPAFCTP